MRRPIQALQRIGPKEVPNNPDMDGLAKYGTASVVNPQNLYGTLPTFNYTEGQFAGAELISGEKMAETILKKRETCYACVVRCKRVVEIQEGAYRADPYYGGPEYETIGTLGSYCGIVRSGRHRACQPDLQRERRGHHRLRCHDCVCDGVLREGHYRRTRRPAASS